LRTSGCCVSIQRVFIRRELYDRVRDMLVSKTKALKQGDPKDVNTVVGPMIDVSEAVSERTLALCCVRPVVHWSRCA
jgi:acyl-CoA reductase-like NAD-dependent aldehyde dehydrogenase